MPVPAKLHTFEPQEHEETTLRLRHHLDGHRVVQPKLEPRIAQEAAQLYLLLSCRVSANVWDSEACGIRRAALMMLAGVCVYIYMVGFRIERPSCRIARPQCRGHVDAIGIHPGSPAWHRRLRRKRAAARARIRSARSTHQEPQVSDLVFLSRHHTRPAFRELRHPMGKRGGWDGQQYGQGYGRYSSQGAYYEKDWHAKGHGKRQGKEAKTETPRASFPSYEMMSVQGDRSGQGRRALRASGSRVETEEMGDARSDTSDLTKFVQKLVNVIRRSDGKLRKCEKDQVEAEAQWQEYQKGLQRAFMK